MSKRKFDIDRIAIGVVIFISTALLTSRFFAINEQIPLLAGAFITLIYFLLWSQ